MSYRYKIIIEYDGSNFVGWQKQQRGPSIQGAMETAIYKFCQQRVNVYGSGRTDAGVHAFSQVAHFDLPFEKKPQEIYSALNYHLKPDPIVVLSVDLVDNSFHARFSAIKRSYRYIIVNRPAPLALHHGRAWHIREHLDCEKMHEAAQILVGQHDFSSFRSSSCQASSALRTIDFINVWQQHDQIITEIASRSFLHNQVRIIMGNLYKIGSNKCSKADLLTILHAKDRTTGSITAPACGLYLLQIEYNPYK